MALLDSLVSANFRSEKAGRVVVFPGDRRHRGYVVKSQAEEQKIRSFLKMFFFAHLSVLILGFLLASGWSREVYNALGTPAAHLVRSVCISLGVYILVAGFPYFLLWSSYKKSFVSFVSPEDEVVVSARPDRRHRIFISIGATLMVLCLGILLAYAVSHKP